MHAASLCGRGEWMIGENGPTRARGAVRVHTGLGKKIASLRELGLFAEWLAGCDGAVFEV